jgi:uncharacterized membrane protein YkvA (DUF1232 family)
VSLIEPMRARARALKRESRALYLAARHPATPLGAKLLAGLVVAYALSPIDLIPDFVPVLGLLDDLILVPAGIALALRLIPPAVMAECRERAAASTERPRSLAGAALVAALWVASAALVAWWLLRP